MGVVMSMISELRNKIRLQEYRDNITRSKLRQVQDVYSTRVRPRYPHTSFGWDPVRCGTMIEASWDLTLTMDDLQWIILYNLEQDKFSVNGELCPTIEDVEKYMCKSIVLAKNRP